MSRQSSTPELAPLAFLPSSEAEDLGDGAVAGACRCATCSRMPLLGEGVTLVERKERELWICDLCLATDGLRGREVRRARIHGRTARLVVRRLA